tara:strand:+ start:3155 stop:3619 length:465 start_codon:yes stop_codon:yes gene_type:complete
MPLKKVETQTVNCSIDKVIAGGRGIEVNGQAYWYAKKSGMTCTFDAGTPVELTYNHLKNTDDDSDVFMIQSLDLTMDTKDRMIDKAVGLNNDTFPQQSMPKFSTGTHETLSKDELITNMNILNRATDLCIAEGLTDDSNILDRCKRIKKILYTF